MALLEHELVQARFQYNLVLVAILEAAERERQRARRRERRWWMREWILHRPHFGQYETLIKELEVEHAVDFKAFLRMEPQMYYIYELLNSVGARPVSVKKKPVLWLSQMHGTPANTRPCTGRRVFRCGYDGAAMRELGEGPVKFSSEVKTNATDVRPVSGRCSAEFGENRIAGSSEPHRPGYVNRPLG